MPGESFLEVLDALLRLAAAADHVPPRGGRREHGRRVRQAHRPARASHRHARPGRDACVGRRAHGVPGLDAADPARRPGRLATRRSARPSRRSTTARMFGPMAKWVAQIDRADRIPEYVHRAFTTACAGPARAGRARAARRTCSRRRPMRPTPSPSTSCSRIPARTPSTACGRCSRARSDRSSIARRRGLDAASLGRHARFRRGERAPRRRGVPAAGRDRQRLAELRRRRRRRRQPEARGARPRRRPPARRRARGSAR